MDFGIASVPAITVFCYLIGNCVKASSLDDKYIPGIVGAFGGMLGVVGLYTMAEFPASDILTAVAVGIISGFAATGINQLVKQMSKGEE